MESYSFKPVDISKHSQICITFRADSFIVSFGDAAKFYDEDGQGDQRYLEWLRGKISKDPASVMHFWHHDQIIGQIELATLRDDPAQGYVNLYYLAPEWRGKGIGAHLDSYAMSYFRQLGLSSARLSVSPTNQLAINYYLKMGWVDLGPRADHPEVNFMQKYVRDTF